MDNNRSKLKFLLPIAVLALAVILVPRWWKNHAQPQGGTGSSSSETTASNTTDSKQEQQAAQDKVSPGSATAPTGSEGTKTSEGATATGAATTGATATGSTTTGSTATGSATTSGAATTAATTSGAATGQAQTQAKTEPAAPPQTCFTLAYHLKPGKQFDEDEFVHHRNLLKLKHTQFNLASLCVRVNDEPVQYQTVKGKSDEILIGPIADAKAKIVAKYCTDQSICKEGCKIPPRKDEFMEAIGGNDKAEARPALLGQWDPNDKNAEKDSEVTAKLDGQLKKELAEVDENGNDNSAFLFNDWVNESEGPACEKKAGQAPSKKSRHSHREVASSPTHE